MIDHVQRIENIVKDELVRTCAALGVDKSEAGWGLGGHGLQAPMITDEGTFEGFAPTWVVIISFRSKLLGMDPIGANIPVFGVLPSEHLFRETVKKLAGEVFKKREQEFREAMN